MSVCPPRSDGAVAEVYGAGGPEGGHVTRLLGVTGCTGVAFSRGQ